MGAGGGGGYVIPDSVEVEGSIFGRTNDSLPTLRRGLSEAASSASNAYGCKAAVSWSQHSRAPIINDDHMADLVRDQLPFFLLQRAAGCLHVLNPNPKP